MMMMNKIILRNRSQNDDLMLISENLDNLQMMMKLKRKMISFNLMKCTIRNDDDENSK